MNYATFVSNTLGFIKLINNYKKISLLSIPIWIIYKHFPTKYQDIKNLLSIKNYPEWTNELILNTTKILLTLMLLLISSLIITLSFKCIHHMLRTVLSMFGISHILPNKNSSIILKETFNYAMIVLLCLILLAISSDMLLSYSTPLTLIQQDSWKWVTIIPYKLLLIFITLGLVLDVV